MKNIPKLRFPEFQNAPEWEEKPLGAICDYWNGGSHEGGVSDDGEYFLISLNSLDIEGNLKTDMKKVDYLDGSLEKNDLVMVLSDVAHGNFLGLTAIIPNSNYVLNQRMAGLRRKANEKVAIEFLRLYINHNQKYFKQHGQGSSQLNLSKSSVTDFPVLFPLSENEQQKIADCLSSLDELITAQEGKVEALKTHKKALMQRLFPREGESIPRLRFPEFQNAPEWKEKSLEKIANPVSERAAEEKKYNILTLSSGYGLVTQGDYFGKKIAGENNERYIKIERNDFVYNDRTTKASEYGTIKRLSKYDSGIVSPIYKCFRFSKEQNPIFWEWYFESGFHDEQLRSLINEGARAGRFNISISKFLSTSIWYPKPEEQQKIADCLSSIDELITTQVDKVEVLKTHKKALMQQLFPSDKEG